MAKKRQKQGTTRTAPQRDGGPSRGFYIALGIVAVAGIIFLIVQMNREGEAATEFVGERLTPGEIQEADGVELGPEDAPVLIEEFSDFMCPSCARYAALEAGVVKERLVETGRARYVFYHFPVVSPIENGVLAARAARCAEEQDAFWQYAEVLYGRQPEWGRASNPATRLVGYAQDLGLDRGSFSSCLYSDRYAHEVTANFQLGLQRGVQGTPTIFVNGEPVNATATEILRVAEEAASAGETRE